MTDVERFRVYRDDETDGGTDDLLGWGARFPSGTCIVDWRLEAFEEEDRLDHEHTSRYGSLDDVEQGTGGRVVKLDNKDVVETVKAVGEVAKAVNTLFGGSVPDVEESETPQFYVSECCGAVFVPGHGPDNIVEADEDDHADARRQQSPEYERLNRVAITTECPSCGFIDPELTEIEP